MCTEPNNNKIAKKRRRERERKKKFDVEKSSKACKIKSFGMKGMNNLFLKFKKINIKIDFFFVIKKWFRSFVFKEFNTFNPI